GMQLAVVEHARHVCGLAGANSMEFDKNSPHLVIDLMPDQRGVLEKGGTMRLGAYPCALLAGTLAAEVYLSGSPLDGDPRAGMRAPAPLVPPTISERHRHRYEVSNKYREALQQKGLVLSGTSPDQRLVEMIELRDHPYFVGCQLHPEFKSRPREAHPLFARFVRAGLERQRERGRAAAEKAKGEPSQPSSTVN